MSTDTISVVIPVYNGRDVLERALAGVDTQTRPPDEIVIVDDGSPDDMEPIVTRFARTRRGTAPINYVRQANTGVGGARNRGMQAAAGAWVALLDQDDEWLPAHLERQLSLAHQRQANFVASDCRIQGGSRADITFLDLAGFRAPFLSDPLAPVVTDLFDRLLRYGCFFMPSTILARRQVLLEGGGFDPQLSPVDDYECWMRLAPRLVFAWSAEPTAIRWIHDANVSSDHSRMTAHQLLLWQKLLHSDSVRQDRHRARQVRAKLAQSHFDCAYYQWRADRLPRARRHFLAGLRTRPSLRTAAYLAAASLPAPWLRRWRAARGTRLPGANPTP